MPCNDLRADGWSGPTVSRPSAAGRHRQPRRDRGDPMGRVTGVVPASRGVRRFDAWSGTRPVDLSGWPCPGSSSGVDRGRNGQLASILPSEGSQALGPATPRPARPARDRRGDRRPMVVATGRKPPAPGRLIHKKTHRPGPGRGRGQCRVRRSHPRHRPHPRRYRPSASSPCPPARFKGRAGARREEELSSAGWPPSERRGGTPFAAFPGRQARGPSVVEERSAEASVRDPIGSDVAPPGTDTFSYHEAWFVKTDLPCPISSRSIQKCSDRHTLGRLPGKEGRHGRASRSAGKERAGGR